jgi:genome maintenance exonuclease 1|tara:strand:- start:2329 stop:3024 length:696 start_codon:yes stop_codon:yes gene_type:complete
MIKINKKFYYPSSTRKIIDGKRHYLVGEEKLPSVTSILSACQSEEKRASLEAWKNRVGEKEATRIKDNAASRGTLMHSILEGYMLDKPIVDLTPEGVLAGKMAQQIVDQGLNDKLEELWASEAVVFYPDMYAGATDGVGIYEGKEAIIDFKQTNKPKRKEWIEDYFLQLAAYAIAHNQIYQTNINFGIILMCSKDNYYQEFRVEGEEFKHYANEWWKKVDQYYKQKVDKDK